MLVSLENWRIKGEKISPCQLKVVLSGKQRHQLHSLGWSILFFKHFKHLSWKILIIVDNGYKGFSLSFVQKVRLSKSTLSPYEDLQCAVETSRPISTRQS